MTSFKQCMPKQGKKSPSEAGFLYCYTLVKILQLIHSNHLWFSNSLSSKPATPKLPSTCSVVKTNSWPDTPLPVNLSSVKSQRPNPSTLSQYVVPVGSFRTLLSWAPAVFLTVLINRNLPNWKQLFTGTDDGLLNRGMRPETWLCNKPEADWPFL